MLRLELTPFLAEPVATTDDAWEQELLRRLPLPIAHPLNRLQQEEYA